MNETTVVPQSSNRGASGINIILGIWVIISPFVLGFAQLSTAMWNNIATGAAIAVCAFLRMSTPTNEAGWSWINLLLGIWLIISSFVLGFANLSTPLWNNVILGVLTIIIAGSSMTATRPQRTTV